MERKDNFNLRRGGAVYIAVGVMVLVVCGVGVVRARQKQTQEGQAKVKAELHRMAGRVVAENASVNSSGAVRVTKYTIEELELPQPVQANVRGRQVSVSRAKRITLYGGPFPVRALPATLKIGDKTVIAGVESPKLDKLTFVVFDDTVLRDNATLTLTYGGLGGIDLGRLSSGGTR